MLALLRALILLRAPQKLHFEVDQFIMVGSPTGLFCALRGINANEGRPLGSCIASTLYPNSAPGALPVCKRFFNVFHPFDPVAYRMEPLIQPVYPKKAELVRTLAIPIGALPL